MKIVVGSDHAGFKLKKAVIQYLKNREIDCVDLGTYSEESVDYPDIGIKVARKVADGIYDDGVLICGSGVGMSIIANKVPGIRAALVMTPEQAEMSKRHNDSNILVLAGRMIDESTALASLQSWLQASFEGGRHAIRVQKIHDLSDK